MLPIATLYLKLAKQCFSPKSSAFLKLCNNYIKNVFWLFKHNCSKMFLLYFIILYLKTGVNFTQIYKIMYGEKHILGEKCPRTELF